MQKEICEFDLANRFPAYTFGESLVGSKTEFEVKDDKDAVVLTLSSGDDTEALCNVRCNLVGSDGVLPLLTTTQRDTLEGVQEGTQIGNITTNSAEAYLNGAWR